jgi:hypothetical protein
MRSVAASTSRPKDATFVVVATTAAGIQRQTFGDSGEALVAFADAANTPGVVKAELVMLNPGPPPTEAIIKKFGSGA